MPRLGADILLVAAIAAGVAGLARGSGGYGPSTWAPAGVIVTVAAASLLPLGLRTSRLVLVAALALVALGGWSIASTAWGGLANQSWRLFDQMLLAAAALALGSLLAAAGKRRLVFPAVLAGIALNTGEIWIRALAGTVPAEWFYGRRFQGAIGYHSAQANLCAIGLALAVASLSSKSALGRALGAGAAGLMTSVLLLTQSRAGIGVALLVVLVTVAWLRDGGALLRAVAVLGGALALVEPLKAVDRALVDQRGIEHALRAYAGWSTVVIVALAALAVPALHPGRVRKALLALVAAAALVTVIVGGVVETRPGSTVHHLISTLGNVDADPALNAAPGETRLISLSFNGRRDAWRVAWSMGREHIVGGHGQGTFPIFWVRERHLDQLYILQPHSILLELLAELGAVGLALFVVAIGSLAGGLARRPPGALPAAAVGGLFALVVQAAVDWTWSFPVLVASVLLVAGAALGGPRGRPPGVPALVAGTAVLLCAIAAFVAPWISNHRVGQAKASSVSDPVSSVRKLDSARKWNRWNPDAPELLGVIAERAGEYEVAADEYAEAARHSQSPWLDHLLEARAAKAEPDRRRRALACAAAHRGNPAETHLYEAVC